MALNNAVGGSPLKGLVSSPLGVRTLENKNLEGALSYSLDIEAFHRFRYYRTYQKADSSFEERNSEIITTTITWFDEGLVFMHNALLGSNFTTAFGMQGLRVEFGSPSAGDTFLSRTFTFFDEQSNGLPVSVMVLADSPPQEYLGDTYVRVEPIDTFAFLAKSGVERSIIGSVAVVFPSGSSEPVFLYYMEFSTPAIVPDLDDTLPLENLSGLTLVGNNGADLDDKQGWAIKNYTTEQALTLTKFFEP